MSRLGFFVMSRYTSIAWFLKIGDAQRCCKRLNSCRAAAHYRVEAA